VVGRILKKELVQFRLSKAVSKMTIRGSLCFLGRRFERRSRNSEEKKNIVSIAIIMDIKNPHVGSSIKGYT